MKYVLIQLTHESYMKELLVNICLYVTFNHFINVEYFNPKFSYVFYDDMFSIQVTMSIWCLSYLLFL